VEDGDFNYLKSALRTGVDMIVAALSPLPAGQPSLRTSHSPSR
jgi:hypothetical protein